MLNIEHIATEIENFFLFPNCQMKEIHNAVVGYINEWKGKPFDQLVKRKSDIQLQNQGYMHPSQMVEFKVLLRLIRICKDHSDEWNKNWNENTTCNKKDKTF